MIATPARRLDTDEIWVGVWERVRHGIPVDARRYEYAEEVGGGRWTYAVCGRPAWETTGACRRAARLWPSCETCTTLTGGAQ